MTSRAFEKTARSGLAVVGILAGLVALGGVSLAQNAAPSSNGPPAAPPAAGAPATGAPASGAADSGAIDKGRMIFTDYGCAQCHSLSDAGATGHVGPSLDGNPNITQDYVKERVTDGQGMMPSFASQLSPDEINAVAAYVAKVAMK